MLEAMTVSETLRRELERCGCSLGEVTRETGIPTSVLSRFANGLTGLSQGHLDTLAEFLGLRLVGKSKRQDGAR